jgi:cob(I)alamin adenosyltransferase
MVTTITTRNGDEGTTSLYSGQKVSKTNLRVEICGDIDELVCQLGLARTYALDPLFAGRIIALQKRLFSLASDIATVGDRRMKLKSPINQEALEALDLDRDELEKEVEIPQGFIVPGGDELSSHLDLARAISRRVERKIVELQEVNNIHRKMATHNGMEMVHSISEYEALDDDLIKWVNRLSDYIYLMARSKDARRTMV